MVGLPEAPEHGASADLMGGRPYGEGHRKAPRLSPTEPAWGGGEDRDSYSAWCGAGRIKGLAMCRARCELLMHFILTVGLGGKGALSFCRLYVVHW